MREITSAGHGYSYEGWARQSREFKQNLGIRSAADGFFEAGSVADGLAQIGEFAFEPPSERTEPEDGGIKARQELQIEVPLTDVRALMRQNDAQLFGAPIGIIFGQKNARSDGDRRGNRGTCSQAQSRSRIQPWSERDRFGSSP